MIEVEVNGEKRNYAAGTTIATMLGEFGLDLDKIAVERNMEIVPNNAYESTSLVAGDEIEVVHFIGGG